LFAVYVERITLMGGLMYVTHPILRIIMMIAMDTAYAARSIAMKKLTGMSATHVVERLIKYIGENDE